MKKILAMLMTFILIMGLASCGSDGSEAGELTKAASEIKLPEAIDYITDMKVDENGCITLAAYERKGDFNGIISISKTENDGESWETLYQREVSIEERENHFAEAYLYLGDSGSYFEVGDWDTEDLRNSVKKRYYLRDFDSEPEEFDFSWTDFIIDDVNYIDFEESYGMKLWGEYGEKTELYRMNIRDRQIEQVQLPEITGPDYMGNDGRYVYVMYYPEIEEEAATFSAGLKLMEKEIKENGHCIRYDMKENKVHQSEILDVLAKKAMLWNSVESNDDQNYSMYAADTCSEEERYYILNDSGLWRIDKNGETLIYKEENWLKEIYYLNYLTVENGTVYFTAAPEDGETKLLKITDNQ